MWVVLSEEKLSSARGLGSMQCSQFSVSTRVDLGLPRGKDASHDIWDVDGVGQRAEEVTEKSGQGVEASCALSIWETDPSLDSLLCLFCWKNVRIFGVKMQAWRGGAGEQSQGPPQLR